MPSYAPSDAIDSGIASCQLYLCRVRIQTWQPSHADPVILGAKLVRTIPGNLPEAGLQQELQQLVLLSEPVWS